MTANTKKQLEQIIITYSLKYLPCSRPNCLTCLTTTGHGPYWYAHFILDTVEKNIFLGKSFKPMDLTQILMTELRYGHTSAWVKKAEQAQEYEKNHLHHPSTLNPNVKGQTPRFSVTTDEAQLTHPKKPRSLTPASRLINRKTKGRPVAKSVPPRPVDFEQDMRILLGAAKNENLKLVYRKLIKKYHPDQYDSNTQLNQWMSEINGTYNRLCGMSH